MANVAANTGDGTVIDRPESMDKYNWGVSKQSGEGWPDAPPISPLSREERARGLAVAFRKAENQIGSPPADSSLFEQARFFLDRAREHNLDTRLYEIMWFVYRNSKEHVITDQVTNPAVIGETP
jgi:hypothetical protein